MDLSKLIASIRTSLAHYEKNTGRKEVSLMTTVENMNALLDAAERGLKDENT